MMPFLRRRRRGGLHVVDAPAVREHERHDVLLDAVLEDLELPGLQIRDELVAIVADDHVGGDEIDADAEGGLLGRRLLRRRRLLRWSLLLGCGASADHERQCSRTQELSGVAHGPEYISAFVIRDW